MYSTRKWFPQKPFIFSWGVSKENKKMLVPILKNINWPSNDHQNILQIKHEKWYLLSPIISNNFYPRQLFLQRIVFWIFYIINLNGPPCMWILRGCNISSSLVTVIGDQLALRRPIFASSVFTLLAETVVIWEVNSVWNIHSRIQPCPADKYILLLNNFSHLNRVTL